MYRFLLVALFVAFGLCAQPQRTVVSPEIQQDHTVVFRLQAPYAQTVKVVGDFLPEGSAEMKKQTDGSWAFTSSVLPSEMYWYRYNIDGAIVPDPENSFVLRDVGTVFSYFFIGGGKADAYVVNDVPHGAFEYRWYDSPKLKSTRRLAVYTPPGYESGKESYPVLYLQHGAGGDETAWAEMGRTVQILDNLIAAKKAQPMLVVMANGNAGQSAAPGASSEPLQKPVFIRPDMFSGNTEAAYTDVISFIDKTYRTKKDKANRAIAGLSMGGMHTIVISANHPELFHYVGVFSSGVIWPKEANAAVYGNLSGKLKKQKAENQKLYWIGIGKTDFLFEQCKTLKKELDSAGIKYVYHESEGGHNWNNWRDYLTEFAPLLFR